MICISQFILQLFIWYKDKDLCRICFTTFEDLLCILHFWSCWSIFFSCSSTIIFYHLLRVLPFFYPLVLFFSSSIANLTFMSFSLFTAPFSMLHSQLVQNQFIKTVPSKGHLREKVNWIGVFVCRIYTITQLYNTLNFARNLKLHRVPFPRLTTCANNCFAVRI